MSAINVNSITGRTGTHGPVLTGVTTVTGDLHVGGGVSFSGIHTASSSLHVVGTGSSVGVGTDDPRSKLDIQGSDEELRFYRDGGDRFGGLRYTGAIFKLRLPTNDPFTVDDASNNERFRVSANGQVKIGGNTLVAPDSDADNLVIDTGDVDSGISILSATTGRIYFGDAGDHEAGSIRYVHTDNSMRFETANTERIRVSAGGSVGIGTNDPKAQVWRNGTVLDVFGGSGSVVGNLHVGANRGDGTQTVGSLVFYDNTQDANHRVVSIIESNKTGSTSNQRGGEIVVFVKENGEVSNSAVESATFTNNGIAFPSGNGIDFSATGNGSGTMSSELFDDYEEGTWEPTFTSTAGDFTSVTYNSDTGARYVKIGSLVTVNGCARCTAIDTSNRSGSDTLCIGGLPFTNVGRDNGDNADNIGSTRVPVWGNTNNCPHAIQARQNQTFCTLLNYEIDNITNTNVVNQASNTMMVQFSLQYSAA